MPCFRVEIDGYDAVATGYEVMDGSVYLLTDDDGTPLDVSVPHEVRQLSPEPVFPPWYEPPQEG